MTKKAMIFTIDAIIAAAIAVLFISSSLFYMKKMGSTDFSDNDLFQINTDSLAVLELNSELKNAVLSSSMNQTEIFLNNILSQQVCSRIEIYNSNNLLLFNATKSSCASSEKISVALRTFVANNNFYYARMVSWYE